MEIPVISRIIGFEAEINQRLQNPTLFSRILAGIENEISQIYSFWTLGALVLAFLATFTRFNLVIFRFRRVRKVTSPSSSSSKPVHDDVDDEDDDISLCSSSTYASEYEEEEDDEEYVGDEDFRVAGSGNYEEHEGHCFNWSDFSTGKNVVKSWRPEGLGLSLGLGLGLGLEDSSGSLVSMWDNNSNNSFLGQIPAVTSMLTSPAVIMSAGLENGRNVALRVWDTRVGRHIPEIFAEWQPSWKKLAVGIDSGAIGQNNKYSVDVRDIRNVKSPVEGLTESDVLLNKNTRWVGGGSVTIYGNNREVGCFNKEDLSPGNDSVSRYLSYLFCP